MEGLKPPQGQPDEHPPKKIKLAESSHEYQGERNANEALREEMATKDCFGFYLLEAVEEIENRTSSVEERLQIYPPSLREEYRGREERQTLSIEEAGALIHEQVLKNVEQFKKLMLNKDFGFATGNFIAEVANIPEVITKLRECSNLVSKSTLQKYKNAARTLSPFHNIFGVDKSSVVLRALIATKKVPDELWLRIIKNHNDGFEDRIKEFKEKFLPELEEKFQKIVTVAIQSGELPISEELFKRRAEQTHVTLKDHLHARLEKTNGSYDVESDMVSIASQLATIRRKKHLEHCYLHEMFHALSGRTIVGQDNKLESLQDKTEPDITDIRHERLGLRFRVKVNGKIKERFRWLNEAVTGLLEKNYATPSEEGKPGYGSYPEEKELFQLLVSEGKTTVDKKLFIDAYFENLDPTIEPEKRLPAWKALSEQIDTAWGHGFLNRVDASVKKVGVTETINLIKSGGISVKR